MVELRLRSPKLVAALAATCFALLPATQASAGALLLIEADSGRVLHAENATHPWYPASVTKVMTAFVALSAVKSGRLSLDSLLTVSARAAAQAPSKMGFKAGTTLTLDNAIKMLMVKSANDIAVVIAEGVGGSVDQFASDMNATSRRLGMTQSHWVNPNGLPAEQQISSARDLAILARAMLREFPEYSSYWNIAAIKLGKKVMRNTNSLIGRYPGADGMKTGFICASGFNLVASASRGGKRLIAVVLGSPSSPVRGAKAAGLLERGFSRNGLSWLTPSLGTVDSLQTISAAPPDLREEMCGKHRKRPAAEDADDDTPMVSAENGEPGSAQAFMLSSLPPATGKISTLVGPPGPVNPILVHVGAAKKSADAQIAAVRAKIDERTGRARGKAADPKANVVAAAPAAAAADNPGAPAAERARAAAATARAASPAAVAAVSSRFGAPPPQLAPSANRVLPAVIDPNSVSWMSFAPRANAEPAPLMATPDATEATPAAPAQTAAVPMPRPRPKVPAAPKR